MNSESKIVDACCFLLKQNGGKMNFVKLMKLLYISDRESLRRHHVSITGDKYVSMNKGPVLSKTLRLKNKEVSSALWDEHLESVGYDLLLKKETQLLTLSESLEETILKVYNKYKNNDQWELVDIVHTFPEWTFPNGSSIPIKLEELLSGAGLERDEAQEVANEIQGLEGLARFSA